MGKKMKLPFLFRTSEAWPPWPSCGFIGNPKTLSFRADNGDSHSMFKTLNSAYQVDGCSACCGESPEPETFGDGGECVENVIRRLRLSERLFFEPGGAKLLEEEEEEEAPPRTAAAAAVAGEESFVLKESVEMEIASRNPFADFRRSMAEMVEAHGGGFPQDWKFLEELLTCYLRINGKTSHGYIVGAFVDLLVELFMDLSLLATEEESDTINVASSSSSSSSMASSSSSINTYSPCLLSSSSSSSTTNHSFTSPLSFCSSLSLLEEADEDETEKSIDNAASSSSSSSPPHFS